MPDERGVTARAADIVTTRFSVSRQKDAPAEVAAALADLEVVRADGTVPLLLCGDIVCLWLADFLAGGTGD